MLYGHMLNATVTWTSSQASTKDVNVHCVASAQFMLPLDYCVASHIFLLHALITAVRFPFPLRGRHTHGQGGHLIHRSMVCVTLPFWSGVDGTV
jgi:hypothetical protein